MKRINTGSGKRLLLVIILISMVAAVAGFWAFDLSSDHAAAQPATPTPTQAPIAPPGGLVGPSGMMGPGGMLGGYHGVTGPGFGGHMGPGGPYHTGESRLSLEQVRSMVQDYLDSVNNPDFEMREIMEFQYNFYAQIFEKSTGTGAFAVLIDPYTGDMFPEPGPNTVWNDRYGVMSGLTWGSIAAANATAPITEEQAKANAEDFLKGYLPESTLGNVYHFYGFYTMEVNMNSATYGLLSVNRYTGQVWYHFWHGRYVSTGTSGGGIGPGGGGPRGGTDGRGS